MNARHLNTRHFTVSLLTVGSLLISAFPVHANPFQGQSALGSHSPLFRTPVVAPASPAPVGAAVGNAAPRRTAPASSASQPVGNGEIQGLGNHDSWIDTGVLANDPRAMCSDAAMGNNTRSNNTQLALSDSRSDRASESRTHNDAGGGGGSFLGIVSVSGSGGSQGSQNTSSSSDRRNSRNEAHSESSSTAVVGRNCDAFVQSAAARDMNYEDNVTERYRIRSGRRGEQVDGLLAPQR